MKTILCALFFFLAPYNTCAESVLLYGDSITKPGASSSTGATSYADTLQALRPDLYVVNGASPGQVSWNLDGFDVVLEQDGPFDHVVILIGTNDIVGNPNYTAHQTFLNIWEMAKRAKNTGAEVWLMAPTPIDGRVVHQQRQLFTRDVANELAHRDLDNVHSHIHFLYLRDEFTRTPWTPLSNDGLHPNSVGAALIGQFVAAALPSP